MRKLIKNVTVLTMDADGHVYTDGYVVVEDGRIAAVGGAEADLAGGFDEVIEFYIYSLVTLEKKDGWDFVALQIPTTDYTVNLGTSRLVNYAHKHDIAVQYWTINDPDEMRQLIEMGVDCIMTDDPLLLKEVLEEYR